MAPINGTALANLKKQSQKHENPEKQLDNDERNTAILKIANMPKMMIEEK